MNQPKDAFNQVKAILGKLDRSITEARSRRLGEALEVEETDTRGPEAARPATTPAPSPAANTQPAPTGGYARMRGQFGRAKPLNKPGQTLPNP
jgi:hypothetical protein